MEIRELDRIIINKVCYKGFAHLFLYYHTAVC